MAIAYNAILTLATIPIYCKGYKTRGEGHHFFTFQALKFILGKQYYKLADYFDDCRSKRNMVDYDHSGRITDKEADELIIEAEKFKTIILKWLGEHYSSFLSPHHHTATPPVSYAWEQRRLRPLSHPGAKSLRVRLLTLKGLRYNPDGMKRSVLLLCSILIGLFLRPYGHSGKLRRLLG